MTTSCDEKEKKIIRKEKGKLKKEKEKKKKEGRHKLSLEEKKRWKK
jgi:hypothetical protein